MKIDLKIDKDEFRKKLDIKDGEDGKTPVKGVDYNDGNDGSPDTPEQIRDKLETLEGKERLHADYIDGLEERLKKMEGRIQGASSRRLFGNRIPQFISEAPTGTVDGVNDTFALSTTPKPNSLLLMWNGQNQRPTATTEYVLSGKTITFNADSIPVAGSLWAYYTKF